MDFMLNNMDRTESYNPLDFKNFSYSQTECEKFKKPWYVLLLLFMCKSKDHGQTKIPKDLNFCINIDLTWDIIIDYLRLTTKVTGGNQIAKYTISGWIEWDRKLNTSTKMLHDNKTDEVIDDFFLGGDTLSAMCWMFISKWKKNDQTFAKDRRRKNPRN